MVQRNERYSFPVVALTGALLIYNFRKFIQVPARQAQLALGVRGVAWATMAGLVGLVCCMVAFVVIARSLQPAEIARSRQAAAMITDLNKSYNTLINTMVALGTGAARPQEGLIALLGAWSHLTATMTAQCAPSNRPHLLEKQLMSLCGSFAQNRGRIGTELQLLDPPAHRMAPAIAADLMAIGRDIRGMSHQLVEVANDDIEGLSNDYRLAILVLTLSTAGFVSAGLVLIYLVGLGAMRVTDARDLLDEAIEALPAGVILYDSEDRLLLFNSMAASATPGLKKPGVLGMTYAELLRGAGKDREEAGLGPQDAWIAEQIARFESKEGRTVRQLFDGRWIQFSEKSTPAGRTVGLRVDITDSKTRELALEHSRAKYQSLVDSLSDVVFAVDIRGAFTFVSAGAADLFGAPMSQLIGGRFKDYIDPEDQDRVVDAARDLHRSSSEAIYELGFQIRKVGGARRHVEVRYRKAAGKDTQRTIMTGVIRDVEERVRLTQRLDQEMARLRSVVDSSGALIAMVDRDLRIVMVNREFSTATGVREADAVGRLLQEVRPIDPALFSHWLAGPLDESQTDVVRYTTTETDTEGHQRILNVTAAPVLDDERIVRNIVFVGTDDTARRNAEAESRSTKKRFQDFFDFAPDAVLITNREGVIKSVNRQAETMFGWTDSELVGQPVEKLIPHGSQAGHVALRESYAHNPIHKTMGGRRSHLRGLRKNGTEFPVEISLSPIEEVVPGEGNMLAASVRDITERLRTERARAATERQLHQSQKMEAVGQLTGGIAHDFNNILTVILANADALREEEDLDPGVITRLDQIAEAVLRASDLTRSLLAFSRKQPLSPKPTALNDLVATTGKLLSRTLGEHIELDAILADDLWTLNVDRAQLESALVNLCVNARDAMPEGGRLLIKTRNVTLDEEYIVRNPDAAAGEHVLLAVRDTGCGIPPDVLTKMFEPFFTTKGVGKGTGLGLSMVYGFIKQSNGHIEVESEVGRGTTFNLYLPRSKDGQVKSAVEQKSHITGGTERVLVVEDDPQVRASVVRQLQSLGYTVSEAADGAAGVAAFETASLPYDLLLTDVVMPGRLNGKAQADEIIRRWPKTGIVFMSGYTDNILTRGGQLDAGVLLLNKPFRKADLAQMVRQAFDGVDDPDRGTIPSA